MSVAPSKHRNKHGRIGTKRPPRGEPSAAGWKKINRRAQTNPWYQERAILQAPRRVAVPGRGRAKQGVGFRVDEFVGFKNDNPSEAEVSIETFIDTKGAADRIGMSVGYVKDHARALGGEKHGLRWRFEVGVLDARWKEMKG